MGFTPSFQRARSRWAVTSIIAAATLVASVLVVSPGPAQALGDTGTGGVFVSSSGRLLDTRSTTTPVAGAWTSVKVSGQAGIPTDGVGAVVLVATTTGMTSAGRMVGRPDSSTPSTLMETYNSAGLGATSNTATLAVGADGTIQVQTSTVTDVILDVQGYYTADDSGTAAGGFVSVPGTRLVDTRAGTGLANATIAPGQSVTVQVTGKAGVPAGASGVVANFIALDTTHSGWITPYAAGSTRPPRSMDYAEGVSTSLTAQVALSADGKVTILNENATMNLIVDVQGYFTAADKTGASFTPATGRVYSTLTSPNTALAGNATRVIQIAGQAGVPVVGSGITAVALTLTAMHSASSYGNATIWADGKTKPGTTAINFSPGATRSNTVIVPLGANGKIDLINISNDSTDYTLDLQGWYSTPNAPTVTCAGYDSGSWSRTIPSNDVACSITAGPAWQSGQSLQVLVDGVEETSVALSATQSVSATALLPLDPSAHEVDAIIVSSEGDVLASSSPYVVGFGDWSTSPLAVMPEDASTAALTPVLVVAPDGDDFRPDVQKQYTISTNPDGVTAPLVVSPSVFDAFTVPSGLLTNGTTYYWTAKIVGSRDFSSTAVTRNTTVHSFTASDAVEEQDPLAGMDDGTGDYLPADDASSPPATARGVKYGPCVLSSGYAHVRKSGGYSTINFKPTTDCTAKVSKITHIMTMTYKYGTEPFAWDKNAWATQVGSRFNLKKWTTEDIDWPCDKSYKKRWWGGTVSGVVIYKSKNYYAHASAGHKYEACAL